MTPVPAVAVSPAAQWDTCENQRQGDEQYSVQAVGSGYLSWPTSRSPLRSELEAKARGQSLLGRTRRGSSRGGTATAWLVLDPPAPALHGPQDEPSRRCLEVRSASEWWLRMLSARSGATLGLTRGAGHEETRGSIGIITR